MAGDLAELGFSVDTTGLKKGQAALKSFSKQGQETESSIDSSMSGTTKSFTSLSTALKVVGTGLGVVAGLAVAVGGPLLAMQIAAAKSTREMGILSSQAKLSISEFDALAFATTQYGVNAEQIGDISKDLADKIGEYSNAASGAFQDYADAMGLTKKEAVATAIEFSKLSSDQVIGKIVSGLESVNASANVTVNVLEALGNDLSKAAPLFANNSKELLSLTERFNAVNSSMALTGAQANQLQDVSTTFDLMTTSFKNASTAISASLAPQFDSFFNAVISIVPSATNTMIDFINSFKDASNIESITSLSSLIEDQETKIRRLKTAIEGYTQANVAYNFTEEQKAALLQRTNADLEEQTKRYEDLQSQLSKVKGKEEELAKVRDGGSFSGTTAKTPASLLMDANAKAALRAADAYKKWKESVEQFLTPTQSIEAELQKITAGLNSGELTSTSGLLGYVADLNEQLEKLQDNSGVFDDWITEAADAIKDSGSTNSIGDLASEITLSTKDGQIDALNEKILLTQDLLEMGELDDSTATEYIKGLSKEIDSLNGKLSFEEEFEKGTSAISDSLSAMRDLGEQGSSSYNKISVAMATVEAAQAAMAIATAATTAAITGGLSAAVSLVMAISTLGGDLETTFEATQAVQGLNEWGDKAESIANSVEDTAKATEDLVGINTDMLSALVNLQSDILSASGIVQGDASATDVMTSSGIGSFFDNFDSLFGDILSKSISMFTFGIGDFLFGGVFDFLGSVFGGSSKTTDSGIKVLGGTLAEMIDGASVLAFETIKSKKYAWSSSKTKDYTAPLDDASAQFSLVFESLADSVYAAGLNLGFSSEYLTEAINEFVIDTSKISLKNLDSSEVTEEIESYFSNVFSDIAESVVYYLDDFQDTGEELSETLTRLSTEVTLLNYAADNLGISLGDLVDDSYSLVSAADALTDILGGTEQFGDALSSFIGSFASDSELLNLYSTALTDSLSEVGLSLPATTQGMWDLIGTLDASTSSGVEQIATLLSLADTASEYYDLLEDASESMADLSDTFASAVLSIYGVSDAVSQVSLDAALAAAKMGDFSLAEALDTSDYNLDAADFSSLADYNVAQAEAANKLMQLSSLAAAEAGDVETEQLDELKAINASIIASITETNTLLRAQNRMAINTSDYLDQINNKTSYAA